MTEAEVRSQLLARIAAALERIADHVNPTLKDWQLPPSERQAANRRKTTKEKAA